MKITFLLSILFTTFSSHSQTRNFELIENIYSNWEKSSNKCETFFYSNTVDTQTLEIVKEQFMVNTPFFKYALNNDTTIAERINFDSIERKFIINQLQNLNSKSGADVFFPNSKFISFGKIDSIQNSVNEKKLDPLVRLCYRVHLFSQPIFLRNNTICLFYSGNSNFAVKEGEFWVYRKEGIHWMKYSPVYQWVE